MKASLFPFLLLLPFLIQAQSIKGYVSSTEGEVLVGANVVWLNTSIGSSTDEFGNFSIPIPKNHPRQLIISYIGYVSDTISVDNPNDLSIKLTAIQSLETVVVTGDQQGIFISSISPIKTEVITQKELTRSACCDLAGCFNTQASVQPTTTNIITNAKELRILGLSGVYNQVLIDGFPLIQGLSYTYGISSVPGTAIKNIYVAKGANSVLQGYESISGQINVVIKDPKDANKLFLNAYLNSFGEKQLNINYSKIWNKWSTLLAVHSTQAASKIDKNEDTFLDLPLLTRYTLYNKWVYRNASEWGWHAKIGLRFINEERIGGQTFFDVNKDKGTTNTYGQTVNYSQEEIYSKFGYRMDDYHHFVIFVSAFHHDQTAYYGTTHYDALQDNLYANLQYELNWKEQHQLKTGVSFRFQDLRELISFSQDSLNRTYAGTYQKKEQIRGFFAENTFNWLDNKWTLITGIRFDYHNDFGWKTTPRILLKANLAPSFTARISMGSGWRNVNLFSENINLLASSRDVIFAENLGLEEALNYGINLTHKWYGDELETQLSLDFYRTTFSNQIFPDYNNTPNQAIIQNFKGISISNGFQAELGLAFFSRIGTKFAYNYLDVYHQIDKKKVILPFNATHRLSSTFSYTPLSKNWHFDANLHWTGEQSLTNTNNNPPEFQQADFSDPYTVINAQLTKTWSTFEVYGGCENIFDFRQEQPILSWQNPFGAYFDTANVWGPTRGREFYIGFRYYWT